MKKRISQNQKDTLIRLSEKAARVNTYRDGMCLYTSALLTSYINNETEMRAKLVAGSLFIDKMNVFVHTPINSILETKGEDAFKWSGHAWVEVDEMILDPSIIKTISLLYPNSVAESVFRSCSQVNSAIIVNRKNSL
ncbi:TPA: hypothetical protein ACPHT2_005099, partial [Vibrio antiquarius]